MKIEGMSLLVFNDWSGRAFEMGRQDFRDGLSSDDSPFDLKKHPWFHDRWLRGWVREANKLTIEGEVISVEELEIASWSFFDFLMKDKGGVIA